MSDLRALIDRYHDARNRHDVDAIVAMHAADTVFERTASATHHRELRRGDLVAPPSGKRIAWEGPDVIPVEDGLIKRKDVYSDSVAILRQVGLL